MTSPQWRKIDELLDSLIELPTPERAAVLDRECGDDQELRRELESLLAAHDQASGFFDSLPESIADDLIRDRQVASVTGRVFGHYQLTREIGRGGMGVVYEAVRADDQYRQKVAVKLLWPALNNSEIARRFRRERQILANLNHSNIARLLDGGTSEEGWPFFVMEFITGEPITDYCQRHKLSIAERLRLFQQVCEAVQFAHQNLVIHRDLKPGNIFVTETGEVKLLDFGIAKLLDPVQHSVTVQPTTHALMMTPEYASPEQMRGEAITTASDVYGLGVILYELLTGQLPYRFKDRSLPELIRVVCEQEPAPPSHCAGKQRMKDEGGRMRQEVTDSIHPSSFIPHTSDLRGDLDGIVLMALHKDAQRRYRSVEQLSEDIRRHLAGQPIQAQTISLSYLAAKFVRRNKLAVAAAAMILLTLLAGIVGTSWQARRATEQARLNRRLLYAAQMNLAGQAWDAANVKRAEQLVESNLPQTGEEDLRGFEWFYLRGLYRQSLRHSLAHPNEVRAVAFSPDGARLATGDQDGTTRIWDAASGQLLNTLQFHTQRIMSVEFSPDGRTLATGSEDNLIALWDVNSGKLLSKMNGNDDAVLKLTFSPNGQWLAFSTHASYVQLFKLAPELTYLALNGHTGGITGLAFSADNQLLASGGSDGLVKIWKTPVNYLPGITKRCFRTWWPVVNKESVWSPDWHVDGCHNVHSEPAPSREMVTLKGHRERIFSVAFSPDGKQLASAGDDLTIKLWDTANWREAAALTGHQQLIRAVAFSPDGKMLASASDDRLVKLWDVAARRELKTIRGHGGRVYSLAFSPDGRSLATASDDHTVKVWDLTEIAQPFSDLRGHTDELNTAVFSPDGNSLVTASDDQTVRLWDTTTGRELKTLAGHTFRVQSAAFSPNGTRVASADRHGKVIVWDAASGQPLLAFQPFKSEAYSVRFSPDGRSLVVTGYDEFHKNLPVYGVRLLDAATGQVRTTLIGHKEKVRAVEFSPNGKLLATAGGDSVVKLWSLETGRELATLAGHKAEIFSLAFSPDSRTLVSGSADRTAIFWGVAARRQLAQLEAHSDYVYSVAFSPDGRRLATASHDDTVKLWDVATRQELITLKGHQDNVLWVEFSPDGQTLASASGDRTIRLWRAIAR